MRHIVPLGTQSIPNAGTDSPGITFAGSAGEKEAFKNAEMWFISAPAAVTGTITVQVSYLESPTTEYVTLQVNAADVTIVAGKSVCFKAAGFRALRIHSSGAEAAQRDFLVAVQVHQQ